MSALYPLAEVDEAARLVRTNQHLGEVGVLCLAPGPGVTDAELRSAIGEDRLNPFRSSTADRAVRSS